MKLRNLMWGACACILAAGCSNDDVAVENAENNIVENGGQAYMRVRVTMGNGLGSRAEEGTYAQGETEEQKIHSIFFAFYDDNGKWVANGRTKEDETGIEEGTGNIDAIADAVVALTLPEGSTYPTQVVAYVNIPNASTIFGGKDLADVNTNDKSGTGEVTTGEGARATVLTGDGATVSSTTSGFMMTNSTYLNAANQEQIATAVTRANFFDTEEAAKEANPVYIYVERLAAKVSITNSADVQDITTVGGYTLHFNAKGFALSGTNTKEYYLKNIQTAWSSWDWNWNKADDYRCFWAEDPNYGESEATNDLNHVSYAAAESMDSPQYCMENTMVGTVGGDYNTTTYLLLVGTYSVKNAEGDVVLNANGNDGNLYMYNGTAYLSTELIERLLSEIQKENPYLLAYVENSDPATSEQSPYIQADADAYELAPTSEDELTTVTLRLKSNTDVTYYTTSDGETYNPITEGEAGNYAAFNTALAKAVAGTIDGYKEGKAYFAMPIEHFGGEDKEGGDTTGTYGIVRNHSYQLTITLVSGLGEGVFQPEKPIIPSDEQKTYYMAARLNVLSWKTVGNQNVEFK